MLRQERQAVKSVSESVGEALERARCAMGVEDQMVVFGSVYTVAEALPLMSRNTGV